MTMIEDAEKNVELPQKPLASISGNPQEEV